MYDNEIKNIASSLGYEYVSDFHNGLANIIAKLKKDNKFFVLKFYTRDYFKKDREQKFIELAQDIITVPKIVDSGENFLIMDFKEGISGTDIFSKTNNKSVEIGKLIGQAAKALHSKKIDTEYVGFLSNNDLLGEEYGVAKSNFKTNSKFLKSLIDEQISKLNDYDVDIPDFSDLEIDIAEDNEKYLIHHDLDAKNILLKEEKLSAILDFEYAMIGSHLFDIAKVHVLGIYLAYHTLGTAKYLDFVAYMDGFYTAYGKKITYKELRPFFIYVLLNYTLFWLSNSLLKQVDKDKILPLHLINLQRLKDNKEIVVDKYL
jgi:aminoglycoside phosphotransferase (APT) family kinase protein